jgi:hypothetical protein
MWEDIIRIIIVLALSWGAYALNEALNPVAKMKQILGIVIIVVCILFCVAPVVDVIKLALGSIH